MDDCGLFMLTSSLVVMDLRRARGKSSDGERDGADGDETEDRGDEVTIYGGK